MLKLLESKIKIVDQNYYEKYCEIIQNNGQIKSEFTEEHHILPQSLFPEHKRDKNNIIYLSSSDHYLAHKFLALATKNHKMCYAFNMMKNTRKDNKVINDDEYNMFKKELSKIMSEMNKNNPRNSFKNVELQRELCNRRWNKEGSRKRQSDFMIAYYMVDINTNSKFCLKQFIVECKVKYGIGHALAKRIFHWFKNGKSEEVINDVAVKQKNVTLINIIVSNFKGVSK
jgi:hypothetical protein